MSLFNIHVNNIQYILKKFVFFPSADLQINSADLAKLLGSAFTGGEGIPGPLTAAVQASGISLTPR